MKEQFFSLHMRTCKHYGGLTLRGGLRAFILACSRSKKASVFAESSGRRPHCSPFIHLALLAFHPHRSLSIAAGTFASTAVEALANVLCLLAKPSNKNVRQQGPHAPALRMDPPIPFTHHRKRKGCGTGCNCPDAEPPAPLAAYFEHALATPSSAFRRSMRTNSQKKKGWGKKNPRHAARHTVFNL